MLQFYAKTRQRGDVICKTASAERKSHRG